MTILDEISQDLIESCIETVRQDHPIVGAVTGVLANDFVARSQNAIGAGSAIVNMPDEAEAMIDKTDAFYINVGTILPIFEDTIPQAGRILAKSGKTWLLDPVGIGLGSLRTRLLRQFKGYQPTIIKGRPAEILSLANLWSFDGGRPSDSLSPQPPAEEALAAGVAIADHTGGVVVIIGEKTLIASSDQVYCIERKAHYLDKLTGIHSILGGLISAYAGVVDPLPAALVACLVLEEAGNQAEQVSEGIGSFELKLIDALEKIDPNAVSQYPFTLKD